MKKDYLAGRQNAVQADLQELNDKLAALAEVFGEKWLKTDGGHPLQVLWGRQDAAATNELINFGSAVQRLRMESCLWLKGQVRLIKTGEAGQSAGAIFEIIALSLFSRDSCHVIPAPESTPGFDGTVVLDDGARILVSVKNHGTSAREREFLENARVFDTEFQAQLAIQAFRDLEVNILATRHLDAYDFRSLSADIAMCLREIQAGGTGRNLQRPYFITLNSMADQYGPLSTLATSSGCRIISPVAKNEQANFEEAVRKACTNLYSHTKTETGDVCRMVILRLSNSASMARCKDWANWYFNEYPADPIDVILLYQAAVITDLEKDTSTIAHHVTAITGPRFPQWQRRTDGTVRRLPDMSVAVGVVSPEQSVVRLVGKNHEAIDMRDHYIYQRVDVFQKVDFVGVAQAALSNPAPGIVIHAVFEENGEYRMTLSPKVNREKTLILLP